MADTAPEMSTGYPEVLGDLKDHLAEVLVDEGVDAEEAVGIAHKAAEHVRALWGGQKIYIPKGDRYELTARDRELWQRFNGRNIPELCREFRLSEVRVRQIIQAVRLYETRRRQSDLFGPAKGAQE